MTRGVRVPTLGPRGGPMRDGTRRDGNLRQVFAVREYRAVWLADLLSVAGDQLARVALAVLVYGRTGSAAWRPRPTP